eukprot:gene27453-34171_t
MGGAGHYAPYFETLTPHSSSSSGRSKKESSGVANGHAMKLWTHPEAQHQCVVCKTEPITAGYRCTICCEEQGDYDICDYCTHKAGRQVVQQVILDRMAEHLDYMERHTSESETAMRTITAHWKRMIEVGGAYASTLQLYEFSLTVADLRTISVAEVRQTRITKEVLRLRGILSIGAELSATAMRESKVEGCFTVEEIDRLTVLLAISDREKTPQVRSMHIVACPMSHAAVHFVGRPVQYMRRDSLVSQKGVPAVATCKICARVAPEGYHCDFCEYDLCCTCAVIFCTQGHPMTMWTVPEAVSVCWRCNKEPITSGYHCNTCNVDMCDLCTTKEGRGGVRNAWEAEMKQILVFMKANKRLSDIASYYHWRSNNYIVSTGLLCEYVKELRMAQIRAQKQIVQKPIIDKIKELRLEATKNVDLCATAAREAARSAEYIFPTKRRAAMEASRLQELIDRGVMLQTTFQRAQAGIACPLGHAAPLVTERLALPPADTPPEAPPPSVLSLEDAAVSPSGFGSHHQSFPTSPLRIPLNSSTVGSVPLLPNTLTIDALADTDIDVHLHSFVDEVFIDDSKSDVPERKCRVCGTADLMDSEGNFNYHSCSYCDYDLCMDCSTVYCRNSHPLRIWTMPDAIGKLLIEFEEMRADSDVVNDYFTLQVKQLSTTAGRKAANLESMSKLCQKLSDLNELKVKVAAELRAKKARAEAKRYGVYNNDM